MHVAGIVERRGVYRVVAGKRQGRISLGRPKRRWEDNIKINLYELVRGIMERNELAQDRNRW